MFARFKGWCGRILGTSAILSTAREMCQLQPAAQEPRPVADSCSGVLRRPVGYRLEGVVSIPDEQDRNHWVNLEKLIHVEPRSKTVQGTHAATASYDLLVLHLSDREPVFLPRGKCERLEEILLAAQEATLRRAA